MLKSSLWLLLPLIILALYGLTLLLVALVSKRPDNLGVADGKLTPCPDSPNCVTTQSDHEIHAMEPLTYTGSTADARQRLLRIIEGMPRTHLIEATPIYVYAEFRTPTFRFVDDVEFYIDEETRTIHFRSASRLGYSDMGLNRRRMETIIRLFEERS